MGYGSGRIIAFAVFALGAVALPGCGTASGGGALTQSELRSAYGRAPAPLAALFRRQDQLLGGGTAAFERELARLRGYPVVVNAWASWCPDCQAEFSILQRVAPKFGRAVAFIGDDVDDGQGARWLGKHPLSFPSYLDPTRAIDSAISAAAASYTPVTYFFNRDGKMVYPHLGPYLTASSLAHDIRLYIDG